MKLKLTLMAMTATLALGYQAQATSFIGTVTNYSKLNVSIVVKTNGTSTTVGNVTKYPVGTVRFSNKDLLALFERSEWANQTFPDGAQLVVGWDNAWGGDALVVDATGTNVIADVTYLNSGAQQFYVFTYENGDYTDTYNGNDPGYETWNEDYMYYVQLEDDALNLYLWGYPSGRQHFIQNWDANGDYSTWSDSEVIALRGGMGGDQEVNNNSSGSVVSGTISFNGHGKGVNTYWY
jgi:hypothetical protein